MLPRLFLRDARLHRMLLAPSLVPLAFLAYVFAQAHGHDRAVLAGTMAFLAGLSPLWFHLRESSEGTLADLAALPVSRFAIVGLRYLEALVLGAAALLLLNLAGLAVQAALQGSLPALDHLPGSLGQPRVLAWLYFGCCAYPMPLVLRWGGRGLGAAVGIPLGLLSSLPILGTFGRQTDQVLRLLGAVDAVWQRVVARPGLEALLLASLLALSFLLSMKAFAGRDL